MMTKRPEVVYGQAISWTLTGVGVNVQKHRIGVFSDLQVVTFVFVLFRWENARKRPVKRRFQ
jgi:hypothetical protein